MAREVLTGARAIFYLDGVQIGWATGVTLREAITYEPIQVLDKIEVDSHEPVGYEASMSADLVRIMTDTLKAKGWFPKQGKSHTEFLTNILAQGEITAAIIDRKTEKVAYQAEGVKISERSVQIGARGVVGESVSMVVKRLRDEADLT